MALFETFGGLFAVLMLVVTDLPCSESNGKQDFSALTRGGPQGTILIEFIRF
jgi:hypothetical protein